ncbi:hypothetical protein [Paraburkholderia sprentiae]|nr:hypothetical protein [Paraburkholderia sprentiae]
MLPLLSLRTPLIVMSFQHASSPATEATPKQVSKNQAANSAGAGAGSR